MPRKKKKKGNALKRGRNNYFYFTHVHEICSWDVAWWQRNRTCFVETDCFIDIWEERWSHDQERPTAKVVHLVKVKNGRKTIALKDIIHYIIRLEKYISFMTNVFFLFSFFFSPHYFWLHFQFIQSNQARSKRHYKPHWKSNVQKQIK